MKIPGNGANAYIVVEESENEALVVYGYVVPPLGIVSGKQYEVMVVRQNNDGDFVFTELKRFNSPNDPLAALKFARKHVGQPEVQESYVMHRPYAHPSRIVSTTVEETNDDNIQ